MAKTPRAIQTPGAAAPAADEALPAADMSTGDESGDAEGDEPAELPSAAELQKTVAQLMAMNAKLLAKLERQQGGPKPAAPALPTVAEAEKMAEAEVAKGKRPRPIHTVEGWYCHPEMARVKQFGEKV